MGEKNSVNNMRSMFEDKKEGFKSLRKGTQISIAIATTGVGLTAILGLVSAMKNKYDILFSGLDSTDANNIVQALESEGIEMKIEGDTIYVPKKDVDRLRLKMSSSVTNGSIGYELMDSGSGFGMTEEEFQLKKLRMVQGEIERTIKTFPQIENARVHITPGEESVFAKDSTPGTSAVYINVKAGQQLTEAQVKSIISLVSASSTNVPKHNVEVIDQNMTLLSDGMFDENGNAVSSSSMGLTGLEIARQAEKDFSKDLEKSINNILDSVFGKGKAKVAVNVDLNFDSAERTEIMLDPEHVVKSQTISENAMSDTGTTGSPVDNNFSNTGEAEGEESSSKESSTEYEIGKTETHTIVAPGEIKKVTASIVLDGVTDETVIENIQDIVETAIGLDANRGDRVSVMSTNFDTTEKDALQAEFEKAEKEAMMNKLITLGGGSIGAVALLILAITVLNKRKSKNELEEMSDAMIAEEFINQAIAEAENNMREENLLDGAQTNLLDEELRAFASKNPEQTTELIKIWLNE